MPNPNISEHRKLLQVGDVIFLGRDNCIKWKKPEGGQLTVTLHGSYGFLQGRWVVTKAEQKSALIHLQSIERHAGEYQRALFYQYGPKRVEVNKYIQPVGRAVKRWVEVM